MERTKTVVLWLLITIGFLCHSICDILPIFWGKNIAIDNSGNAPQSLMIMMATLMYLIPVCGIMLLYLKSRVAWIINAILAVIMALFTIVHAGMELFPCDNYAQLIVLPLMMALGVLLALKSVRLTRKSSSDGTH